MGLRNHRFFYLLLVCCFVVWGIGILGSFPPLWHLAHRGHHGEGEKRHGRTTGFLDRAVEDSAGYCGAGAHDETVCGTFAFGRFGELG